MEVKVICDCNPQKSSLAVTQTNPAQVPENNPISVSKLEPQRLKVVLWPLPTNVYQIPGAVPKFTPLHMPTASAAAPTVVPVMVWAQLMVTAPEQGSLTGGQLVHCTVVVRQVLCVPQVLLVDQCAYTVPVKVLAKLSGVCPNARTGPPGVPDLTVIQSVATLLVNRSVCPFTAPFIVEYSPANEQVEMVTIELLAGMVAVPKAEAKLHWL